MRYEKFERMAWYKEINNFSVTQNLTKASKLRSLDIYQVKSENRHNMVTRKVVCYDQ